MLSTSSIAALLEFLSHAPSHPFSHIGTLVQRYFAREEYSLVALSLKILVDDHVINRFTEKLVVFWVMDFMDRESAAAATAAVVDDGDDDMEEEENMMMMMQRRRRRRRDFSGQRMRRERKSGSVSASTSTSTVGVATDSSSSSSNSSRSTEVSIFVRVLLNELTKMDQFAMPYMQEIQARKQGHDHHYQQRQQQDGYDAAWWTFREEQMMINAKYKLFILKLLSGQSNEVSCAEVVCVLVCVSARTEMSVALLQLVNMKPVEYEGIDIRVVQNELERTIPECRPLLQRLMERCANDESLGAIRSSGISPVLHLVRDKLSNETDGDINEDDSGIRHCRATDTQRSLTTQRLEPRFLRPMPPLLHEENSDECTSSATQSLPKSMPFHLDDLCWIDIGALETVFNNGEPLEPQWMNLMTSPVHLVERHGIGDHGQKEKAKSVNVVPPDEQFHNLLSKALKQQLLPLEQDNLIKFMKSIGDFDENMVLLHSLVTPSNLQDITANNANVTVEILIKFIEFNHQSLDEYFLALANMPVSIQSMETITQLLTRNRNQISQRKGQKQTQGRSCQQATLFPKQYLHLYIANGISAVDRLSDQSDRALIRTRLVRLLCVFIQSLIRNGVWNTEGDDISSVEVKNFLSDNLAIHDAQQLYVKLYG